jgi:plasmid stabilization system protein ParE
MSAPFQLTPQASEDLDAIWWFIQEDSQQAADRVEAEIVSTCHRLARHPIMGHKRQDITPLPVRFWTIPKYPNYIIIYRPESKPLQVIAILHGNRDLKEILKGRLPVKL